MPAPLPATLSTVIRQGIAVPSFVNGLVTDNSQQAFQVAGIPVSLGAPIRYNSRYQYSIINSCPDVIDLITLNTLTGANITAVLNDMGICVLLVTKLVGTTYELVSTQFDLNMIQSHGFLVELSPSENYRIVAVSGYPPTQDLTTPNPVISCSPEIIDLNTTISGNLVNINATLTGNGTCVAIAVSNGSIINSIYNTTSTSSHTFNFNLPIGSYRIYVFAVGFIRQDT